MGSVKLVAFLVLFFCLVVSVELFLVLDLCVRIHLLNYIGKLGRFKYGISACYTNISCACIPLAVIIFGEVNFVMFNVCVFSILAEHSCESFFRGCV